MFRLNSNLKTAYRAQQKSCQLPSSPQQAWVLIPCPNVLGQIAESAANQAKRRFASYLFHEVRVPLNTASAFQLLCLAIPCSLNPRIIVLAFQNLNSEGAFRDVEQGQQSLEIFALDSSLTTMQQVSVKLGCFVIRN